MNDKKLSILVIPYIIPYPATDGGKICTFSFIDKLKESIDFSIVLNVRSEQDEKNVTSLQAIWQNVNICTIKSYAPKTIQEPIGIRRKLINLTKSTIRKYTKRKPHSSEPISLIEDHGITFPFSPFPKEYIVALNSILTIKNFDLIQIDHTNNLNLVHLMSKSIPKIFVEIESRYSILNDYINLKQEPNAFDRYVVEHSKFAEFSLMSKFDAIFTLSDTEKKRITAALPEAKIYSSPFSVADDHILDLNPADYTIEKLVFIGPEEHYPNMDAVDWFIKTTLLQSDFNIPLHIIGKWDPATVAQYGLLTNVVFTGYIDDVKGYLKKSIMVTPIRLGGGGLRTKILMAMAQGVPIVSTNVGVDGFDFVNEKHFLLANDPITFTAQINKLITTPTLAYQMAIRAQNLFKAQYSQNVTAGLRFELYQKVKREHV